VSNRFPLRNKIYHHSLGAVDICTSVHFTKHDGGVTESLISARAGMKKKTQRPHLWKREEPVVFITVTMENS